MNHLPTPAPARSATVPASAKRARLERRRSAAKWGMVAALGVLVVTGYLKRSRHARLLHVAAGGALLGLSYWHQTLYVSDPRRHL